MSRAQREKGERVNGGKRERLLMEGEDTEGANKRGEGLVIEGEGDRRKKEAGDSRHLDELR